MGKDAKATPAQTPPPREVAANHRKAAAVAGKSHSLAQVLFHPLDDKTIIVLERSGVVRVWDLLSDLPRERHSVAAEASAIAAHPFEGTLVFGRADGTLRQGRAGTGRGAPVSTRARHDAGVTAIAVSPRNAAIVTGAADGTMQRWNEDGSPRGAALHGHRGRVAAVALSPADGLVVSGGDDGLLIWPREGVPPKRVAAPTGPVRDVTVSVPGNLIASAGADGVLRLFDREGKPGAVARGHEGGVDSVAVSPKGYLASGGDDGTVRLWSTNGAALGEPLRGHGGAVTDLAFSPRGDRLVSVGADGSVVLWKPECAFLQLKCDARGEFIPIVGSAQVPVDRSVIVRARNVGHPGGALRLDAGGDGACDAPCGETLPQGATVTLTATPERGAVLLGWSGACDGAGPVCTITPDTDAYVEARFGPRLEWSLESRVGLDLNLMTPDGHGGILVGGHFALAYEGRESERIGAGISESDLFGSFVAHVQSDGTIRRQFTVPDPPPEYDPFELYMPEFPPEETIDIATDNAGNILLADRKRLRMVSPQGQLLWERRGYTYVHAVAATRSGDWLVVGALDERRFVRKGSCVQADLERLSPGGRPKWRVKSEGHCAGALDDVVEAGGRIYATGVLRGRWVVGKLRVEHHNSNAGLVAAFRGDGAPLWARKFGAPSGYNDGHKVAIAPDGDVLVAGKAGPGTTFGDIVAPQIDKEGFVLVRYRPDGTPRWAQTAPDTWVAEALAVDDEGTALVTASRTVDGYTVGWLGRFSVQGDLIWSVLYPGVHSTIISNTQLVLGESGAVFVLASSADAFVMGRSMSLMEDARLQLIKLRAP